MDSSMDLKSMTLEELTDCVMELGKADLWMASSKTRKKSGRDEECSSQMY